MSNAETSVVIAGAGPTGLTLACALALQGVPFRLLDVAPDPFIGSRAKGLQPRTLEVFDDLGVIGEILGSGADYPRLCVHLGPLKLSVGGLSRIVAPTPSIPYPNLWMLPEWRTSEILASRVVALGGRVERGVAVQSFDQDSAGVRVTLAGEEGEETVVARYLVACDGGKSSVRKALGLRMVGEEMEGSTVVVADVEVSDLDRSRWHIWPFAKRCVLTLCPMPGTACFQLAASVRSGVQPPEPTEAGIARFIQNALGEGKVRIGRVPWASIYRTAHASMVDRYRVGRVFLAGDAAHVHPPSGGQGLNTGVQDAYNLGWKLASVLRGAPASLLDTYEAERLPVAAAVLGLSKRLYTKPAAKRGAETRQLGLHYRLSPLSDDARRNPGALRGGDRAPDAVGTDARGGRQRLFDRLRGSAFTLLVFGEADDHDGLAQLRARWPSVVNVVRIVRDAATAMSDDFVDLQGHARKGYDVTAPATVLVRPDGYVGLFCEPPSWSAIDAYLSRLLGPSNETPADPAEAS
jgi:2-polyprenyl-6-methoxyphenol hydroxylase-like FAD-dependent oxidoreductase